MVDKTRPNEKINFPNENNLNPIVFIYRLGKSTVTVLSSVRVTETFAYETYTSPRVLHEAFYFTCVFNKNHKLFVSEIPRIPRFLNSNVSSVS